MCCHVLGSPGSRHSFSDELPWCLWEHSSFCTRGRIFNHKITTFLFICVYLNTLGTREMLQFQIGKENGAKDGTRGEVHVPQMPCMIMLCVVCTPSLCSI